MLGIYSVCIAGIQITWTSNLADHLQMRDDDTRVANFNYASFLEYQRSRYATSMKLFEYACLKCRRYNSANMKN